MDNISDPNKALHSAIGKTISDLKLGIDDALHFTFSDNSTLKLFDGGQNCCEVRYMRTDDNLIDYVGANLEGIEIRDGSYTETYECDCHEIQFLAIKTSKGEFVMSSHNEHNGYYGRFSIMASNE